MSGVGSGILADEDLFARIVAGFGHLLHSAGVPVTPERSTRFGTAIALARPMTVDELYWLGRVTLLTARDQTDAYDAVFRQVFEGMIDMADFRGDTTRRHPRRRRPRETASPATRSARVSRPA